MFLSMFNPLGIKSDLLKCHVDSDAQVVACPLKAGSVTFHHSKMPHMTTGNFLGQVEGE